MNFMAYGEVNNLLGFGVSGITSSFLSELYWHSLWDYVQKADCCGFLNSQVYLLFFTIWCNFCKFPSVAVATFCYREQVMPTAKTRNALSESIDWSTWMGAKFWITIRILLHELFLAYNLVYSLLFWGLVNLDMFQFLCILIAGSACGQCTSACGCMHRALAKGPVACTGPSLKDRLPFTLTYL
jgi:hypothetical protein